MTNLHTLTTALAEAEADLALAERIATAKERVAKLTKELAEAEEEALRAEARRAAEAADARLANITDVQVTSAPSKSGNTLQHLLFTITWRAPRYDMRSGTSPVSRWEVVGFHAVPENVLAYLVEKAPDRIPPEIMALAPNSPARAMEAYLAGKRRGYFRSAVQ
ncbi:hypothetical protein [Alteriqipengyuania lutimaris]|uniref:hypothetical protein n=1 Tax=Alteriqipengyuania lutimaris TaxID=1538146 RepID=UPI001CFE8B1D|nr:hypothetical protein [Alteriqipengyuania lutimaris]